MSHYLHIADEIPSPERLAFDGFQTLKWTQQLLAEAVSHYKVHCVSTNCLTSETIIADMDEVERKLRPNLQITNISALHAYILYTLP